MVTQTRVHLQTLVLLFSVVHLSRPVCVDVPSETDAVQGYPMKLTCISCLKRDELKAKTRVDWYFMPNTEKDVPPDKTHIYKYDVDRTVELDGPFKGRLTWNGSQDLQDLSIQIINVTFNDSGVFECHVVRTFEFDYFTPSFSVIRDIKLKVKEKATKDPAALYSEIMMYVLLVCLTLWLLIEMVYCYRKISKSDEQTQDTATNYLAIPSEQKDNPAAPVTE
ncbi:sodium channel subunit beta-3 isoform X1 [Sebastes umbrosus]|uniref:sodium channel subunit beta-3 isoform X1 n=1 Tax=Sebastes umbrosus TaxID=72105 RepID=UPI0018A01AEE|nr:sodium channel subunit beta-3 isoform X1 [Sebastes umbrosus]XP_037632310.1 sodium channel subunit beta-3 isoform X1 [Sebastes umbrosus]